MATYRKTESENYEFLVDLGKNPTTGKRIRKSKTFEDIKAGKKWVAKMELEQEKK